MIEPTAPRSFEKVDYQVRPSKQVERRLFVEVLHRLSDAGLPIQHHVYVGLGSVFYVDFQLFHRYLYIDNMICCESADIPHRMEFNKPYDFIKLRCMPVQDLVPEIEPTKPYFVWLDYDGWLDKDVLLDVEGFASRLGPGSILVVTVDAEVRLDELWLEETDSVLAREERLCEQYNETWGKYLQRAVAPADVTNSDLPRVVAEVLRVAIGRSVTARPDLKFVQLFNYRYADGAQMMTVGGVIADERLSHQIQTSGLLTHPGVEPGPVPRAITVPPLTSRERDWIDQRIANPLRAEDLPFELEQAMLDAYIRYYRHYPTYRDLLL